MMESLATWWGIISPKKVNHGQRWPRQLNICRKPGIQGELPIDISRDLSPRNAHVRHAWAAWRRATPRCLCGSLVRDEKPPDEGKVYSLVRGLQKEIDNDSAAVAVL